MLFAGTKDSGELASYLVKASAPRRRPLAHSNRLSLALPGRSCRQQAAAPLARGSKQETRRARRWVTRSRPTTSRPRSRSLCRRARASKGSATVEDTTRKRYAGPSEGLLAGEKGRGKYEHAQRGRTTSGTTRFSANAKHYTKHYAKYKTHISARSRQPPRAFRRSQTSHVQLEGASSAAARDRTATW